MKIPSDEKLIQDAATPEKMEKSYGVEIEAGVAKKIADELSRINDLVNHDGAITADILKSLNSVVEQTKIDIGGEMMTVEEAERIPDLKINAEIWREMSAGNFDNTDKLTRITPNVSKCLENAPDINLDGLTSAKGLVLPRSVAGGVYLNGLTSAEGLVLPTSVKGTLSLNGLTSAENLTLPTSVGKILSLREITSPKGLVLPSEIGESIILTSLTSAEGLVFPQYVNGDLCLDGVISPKGLVLPKRVNGDLLLTFLKSAEGLVLPDMVSYSIHLETMPIGELHKIKIQYPRFSRKIV